MLLLSFNGKDIHIIEVNIVGCYLSSIADVERSQARSQPLDDIVQLYADFAIRLAPEK
jgi:hypothetical protein